MQKEWNRILILKHTHPLTKNRFKDLIIRLEIIKCTEENIRKGFDICLGYDFTFMITKTQTTKAKINKWDFIKLRLSILRRKHHNEKADYGMGENICKHVSEKGFICRIEK